MMKQETIIRTFQEHLSIIENHAEALKVTGKNMDAIDEVLQEMDSLLDTIVDKLIYTHKEIQRKTLTLTICLIITNLSILLLALT